MPPLSLSDSGVGLQGIPALRPTVTGTRHMISAGHFLAAEAGFEVLEAGGNAFDAAVAGGLVLGVVQSDIVNIAGVAPIILYLAESREVVTVSGLGTWPRSLRADFFQREHDGQIPEGVLRTVVPAAPDAWITLLERYGTMSFGDVAGAAIRFARDGFVMYPLMAGLITSMADNYRRWPSSTAIYLPDGRPPEPGRLFVQADLGRTLQYMVNEEKTAAGRSREAGLQAARDAFYRGDIAATIVRYHAENGGLLRAEDLADFRVGIEPPVHAQIGGIDVYTCGPWCQGPMLLQALGLLAGADLATHGHNGWTYIHRVTEALKLAFADRHHYYGDPRFVDVPMDELLSPAYAAARRTLIRDDEAWPEMPPPGDPFDPGGTAGGTRSAAASDGEPRAALDTSYLCVIDRRGNAVSATPSDGSYDTPVIPGTGLCPSSRGSQSWADPTHASAAAPGKRPRLTPNPALAIRDGEFVMPFGTPGGDIQVQAMLQVFLNVVAFGMDVQAAVEAPRFATQSFPDSFEPHRYYPGRLNLEARLPEATGTALAALGHDVHWWPEWIWQAGAVCLIRSDLQSGILSAGADPRRPCYALGW